MYKFIFSTLLSLICFTNNSIAQNEIIYETHKKPKLVVKLIVSHMRYDYLSKFVPNMSDFGFKRLIKNGVNYTNARYSYMFTQTSPGIATISTGSQPSQHGIIGDGWINYTTNEEIDAIYDETVHGVGCNEDEGQFSPRKIVFSTIADELKRKNPKSKVVSIALDSKGAVLAGGYTPDGVYWFDERYGNFATSTYYKPTLPIWVRNFNNSEIKNNYAADLWVITKPFSKYKFNNASAILVDSTKKLSFNVLFKAKNKDMSRLMETPFGNSYIKDFALEAIKRDSLGADDIPDLLIINFGATKLITEKYGVESTEIEDSFYRLDDDIATLIDHLENTIGKENIVIVLTSNHGSSDNVIRNKGLASGTFNATQFRVLMSGFMNATFGVGDWVSAYKNRQIYLNRRLIFEKGLSLSDIQNQIATFALQFGGVANAITATALQNNYYGKGITHKIQNSFFPKHSGDVIINLLPGWIELKDESSQWVSSSPGSPYEYDTHVPLIWYGGLINNDIIHRHIDMIDIAPTISEILGVSYPNASEGQSLTEIIHNNKPNIIN